AEGGEQHGRAEAERPVSEHFERGRRGPGEVRHGAEGGGPPGIGHPGPTFTRLRAPAPRPSGGTDTPVPTLARSSRGALTPPGRRCVRPRFSVIFRTDS